LILATVKYFQNVFQQIAFLPSVFQFEMSQLNCLSTKFSSLTYFFFVPYLWN